MFIFGRYSWIRTQHWLRGPELDWVVYCTILLEGIVFMADKWNISYEKDSSYMNALWLEKRKSKTLAFNKPV